MITHNNKKGFLHISIIFLTSFIWGIVFSYYITETTDIKIVKNIENNNVTKVSLEKKLDLTKFWEIYNIIKKYNYNEKWIKDEDLINGAIKGLVEWLWDKHSVYFDQEENKKFMEILSWDFEWIWAVVEKNPLWVKISRLIKWSPAKKYWLKSWDIIIKSNNNKLEDIGLYEAVALIKWPAGTKVTLEIIRKTAKQILKIDIIRDKIKIPSVNSNEIKDTNIAYISINMFWEDTAVEFLKILRQYQNKEWIIIDLRDNWWGFLMSAVSILSNFIEKDQNIVTTKYKELFSNIKYPSINDWFLYKWKIIVLINENSASASEITAWALRDYKKAIIVWTKSYWKGSVQKPFDLKDGSMLKLTIAKWFTPNNVNIDKEWITPDIKIDFKEEDFENNYDRQLEESQIIIQDFIKTGNIDNIITNYINK